MIENPVRLLLVDDHPLVREGLRALLTALPNITIVGEASDGEEAVTMALDLQPDLILMDLHLPKLNGIEATRRIVGTSPHMGVLVLTMLGDDDSVFGAMRAGARGYLLKGAGKAEVLRAITVVAHGEAIFSPQIAQRLVQYFANMRPVIPEQAFPDLTQREREVLALIVDGKSNAQIAGLLVLSPKTVSNHISNIFSKLQVVDRAQAVTRARQAGGEGPC
jgi:DNA-binding NarL/FixJ family response regulator